MPGKTAFVFPGQGSQKVGMGLDLYHDFECARDLFRQADDILGFSLSDICFSGPEDELTRTRVVQPALLTVSAACLAAARQQGTLPAPAFTAGHSLGEYTALLASGVMGFGEALELVSIRAGLMESAASASPGKMLALIGADEDTARRVCQLAGTQISNFNSPGQIVISGPAENVDLAGQIAPQEGVRKAIPLRVSGAFHSRLMQPAADGLKAALGKFGYIDPDPPVVANASARVLTNTEEVRQELEMQLLEPVLWQQSVESMSKQGVENFIEFGPGQVLAGLIRRIAPSANIFNVSGSDSLCQAWS